MAATTSMKSVFEASGDDAAYMARALRLAERGLCTTDPNPRVGCVIVKEDRIVGEGWHKQAGGPHAEVEALNTAGVLAQEATAYVTLEPCCHFGKTPPCTEALIDAGVARVVAAMRDPNPRVAGKGLEALAEAGIATHCGLLSTEAEALNRGFCKRMRSGRPYLVSKLAMSLDGRTAMASGESRWITGVEARQDVHRLRARSSAILTGIGTVLADDPQLTVRLGASPEVRQPARVVIDSGFRIPMTARLIYQPGRAIVIGVEGAHERVSELQRRGVEVYRLPAAGDGRVDLHAALDLLGRLEINEVMVEAGQFLNGALMAASLVDEWVVYLAPCVLGDGGRGLFHLPRLQSMAQRFELTLVDVRQVGKDLRLRFV